MGFERVALFGIIDLDLEATAGGTLYLSTDLPGSALSVRETKTIPATSRRPVRFRLQGTTTGHLYKLKVDPGAGQMRIYGGRIWARVLPGEWAWYPIPLIETPVEFTPVKLPIPPTSEEWTAAPLPVPPTGDWAAVQLPIKPTPNNPEWVDIPVDQ